MGCYVMKYTGIVIEESLDDNRIINKYEIKKVCITGHEKPQDRWHMYEMLVSTEDISELSRHVLKGWYMHFWKDREILAIFEDKQFKFNYDNKETWKEVLDWGRHLGIPEEQLDFPINGL